MGALAAPATKPKRRKRAAILSGCIRLEAMSRSMRTKQESHRRLSEKRSRRLLPPGRQSATSLFFQRINEQRIPCLLDCFNTGMNASVVGKFHSLFGSGVGGQKQRLQAGEHFAKQSTKDKTIKSGGLKLR